MRIRRARPDDLGTLVDLASALFIEDGGTRDDGVDVEWPRVHGRPYYGALIDDGRALVLLAEAPAAVGFLIGRLVPRDPLRPGVRNAELESMFVSPTARSHGIGRALADEFRRWTVEHGSTHATVTAYATNNEALRFYRSLGYRDRKVTLEL